MQHSTLIVSHFYKEEEMHSHLFISAKLSDYNYIAFSFRGLKNSIYIVMNIVFPLLFALFVSVHICFSIPLFIFI